MTKKIGVAQVRKALKALPPERSNEGVCKYVQEDYAADDRWAVHRIIRDEPHCIAANVMHNLGLPIVEWVKESEGVLNGYVLDAEAVTYFPEDTLVPPPWRDKFTPAALELLNEAQKHADKGSDAFLGNPDPTWGEVVEYLGL